MRSVVLVAVLLAACAAPVGSPVEECDASWRGVESHILTPGGSDPAPVPIDCIRRIDENRIRIGFLMPAGPSCYQISAIHVVEGASSVSVTLVLSEDDSPASGACPTRATRAATEIDLQAPVADRTLLDGSVGDEAP